MNMSTVSIIMITSIIITMSIRRNVNLDLSLRLSFC